MSPESSTGDHDDCLEGLESIEDVLDAAVRCGKSELSWVSLAGPMYGRGACKLLANYSAKQNSYA